MRQSFKRAGLLMTAVLLALAGAVFMAGPASAAKLQNRLNAATVTQACTGAACAKDALEIPSRTFVDTYCVQGNFNVTYTGPATGRGGFVNTARFDSPGLQTLPCNNTGIFGQVGAASTILRSCSGPCVNFGNVSANTLLRGFCQLSTAPNRWYLVYVDSTQRAGFVPEAALTVKPGVPSCNP
jgi:hypothetical protein